MNEPRKTYRLWDPEAYRQQAHSPLAKLPEGDLVFFLLDLMPHLDLRAIYAPFCTDTAVSFEEEAPSEAEMRRRITTTLNGFPWLVADQGGEILGYVYARPYRERAGYDAILQGFTGLMSITGEPEGSPVKVGVALIDAITALYAHGAILAALHHRGRTGEGQYLELSLMECGIAALINAATAITSNFG